MREKEPVQIDNGFYISRRLDSEDDVEKLIRAGIKRVVFFSVMPQMQIARAEEIWLNRRGINLVCVPFPDFPESVMVGADSTIRNVLEKIGNPRKKPVLLHCFTGNSSQSFAIVYLISRGNTYSVAKKKVNAAVTSAGIRFHKIQPEEEKVLMQLETRYKTLFADRFRRRRFAALGGKRIVRAQKTRRPHRFQK